MDKVPFICVDPLEDPENEEKNVDAPKVVWEFMFKGFRRLSHCHNDGNNIPGRFGHSPIPFSVSRPLATSFPHFRRY